MQHVRTRGAASLNPGLNRRDGFMPSGRGEFVVEFLRSFLNNLPVRIETDMTLAANDATVGALPPHLGGQQDVDRRQIFRRGRKPWLIALGLIGLTVGIYPLDVSGATSSAQQDAAVRLADEVRDQGWIVYGARSSQGDWDLFTCRPDGSTVRPLTRTPNLNEFSPQVSRDGQRLLFRRVKRDEKIDNNRHGEQGELVVANSDGTDPQTLGAEGEFPWASWSPDGKLVASLSIKGVVLIDLATKQVVRRLERKGFFQQMTWSPDGQWLVGVANSYGTGWSIARMNVATGESAAINRIDCCTPDWSPDSQAVIFSWRPPGQKTNKGYGWTQLWMGDAEGISRRLVYGEDGRHVYGGQVSPDGKYVLFTGNLQEDGDPGNAGAPMGLMRLSDVPCIGGVSLELRALHPNAKDGTVLELPVGWEPCWTSSDIAGASASLSAGTSHLSTAVEPPAHQEPSKTVTGLASELHGHGWIVFSSKTERGDGDLFRRRPDGTDRHKFIDMPGFNEGGARFSPDGKRVLFYRLSQADELQNNEYGTGELVIAQADGSQPVEFGNGFPWATWGADGRQVACLAQKGIQIVDLESRQSLRQLPRKGMVSQLGWSPDGKWFTGTASHLGPFWNIARMSAETGEIVAVSETDRYNCTPDWVADSRRIVYARGIIPEKPGRAELWVATLDGHKPQPLYAEEGHHIYGACASPDMKYLLFTRSFADLTKVDQKDTTMAIVRWSDTPMRGDEGESLRKRLPQARTGPRLDLGPGWEPFWTLLDLGELAAKPASARTRVLLTRP
jgi:Tol biopolymer transport system component